MFKKSGQAISQSIASELLPAEENLKENRFHVNRPFLRKKEEQTDKPTQIQTEAQS